MIILTADHGEGLGNHGYLGHASELYQEQLHVPLILSWPTRLPLGKTVDTPVSLIDVLPTITQLLSIQDDSVRSGRSLVPLIEQEQGLDAGVPIVAKTFRPEAHRGLSAIMARGFKLILGLAKPQTLLYDISRDPSEHENQAENRPDIVSELKRTMMEHLDSEPQRTPSNDVLTEEQLRRLRSLGYVR